MALVINLGVDLCFQSWSIGKCYPAFLLRIMTKVVEYILESMETNKTVKNENLILEDEKCTQYSGLLLPPNFLKRFLVI